MGATAPPRPGNAIGRMTGLTLFTPIRRQWLPLLRVGFFAGAASSPFIHAPHPAVQLHQVRALDDRARPRRARSCTTTYLFFESNFDGPWQHYIDAFAYVIPKDIRLTWGRGLDFPDPPPAEPLKAWIARNSMEGGTYYCAYPEASTRMVRSALDGARAPRARWRATPSASGPRSSRPPTSGSSPTPRRTSDGRVPQPRRRRLRADRLHADPARPRGRAAGLPRGAAARRARARSRGWTRCTSSRVQIFDELVDQGPPHKRRDAAECRHLVFTSTIDGDLDPYLDAICERMAPRPTSGGATASATRGRADRAAFRACDPRPPGRHEPVRRRPIPSATVQRRARGAGAARARGRLRRRGAGPRRRGAAASASWPPSGLR